MARRPWPRAERSFKDVDDMNDLNQDLLAALLDSEDDELIAEGIPALAAPGVALPLSFSQQQLWFLQQYEPGLTAYNLPRVFRLRGALDVGALQQAFQALIDRHAVLRTRYESRDGVAVQCVLASAPFVLGHEDCRHLPAREGQARAAEAVDRTVSHVFDLGTAPPLVARVVTVSADEHVLAVCLHHIASDAWSNPLIARDLAEAYRLALSAGDGPPQWPALPVQYADYAAWQRARADEGGFQRELAYWNAHLGAEVPTLNLPTDLPRGTQRRFEGAAALFEVDAQLSADLVGLGRALQCTPFMLMLAAWQALLSRQAGQGDFAIGVAHAGRHRPEARALVGFFINTQVFRARVAPGMSWRALCRQVRENTLAAMDHADLPFEVLLDSRTERRDPARSPLFQVMFGLQVDDGQTTLALEGLQADALDAPATGAKFELSLDITLTGGLLQGRLEYATALFTPTTAQRLVEG
ncbi:MAG: non-ribosomal peptide synthetase, partial [Rubrivivax sp.]